MEDYYKILGITADASEAEIKRAYFRLIRTHSPESDPEMFQKIRHAYEQLKDGGGQQEAQLEFPPFSDPFAERMMDQIRYCFQVQDLESAKKICEEAWMLFPQDTQFLYYLVILQRRCGNTGKAVKNAEKLVKIDPENRWFWRELALSCMERGYTKKAFPAFTKAYDLGCKDTEFVIMYSDDCSCCDEDERGIEILMGVIRSDRRWKREELAELFEVFFRLFSFLQYQIGEEVFDTGCDLLLQVMEEYRGALGEYASGVVNMLYYCNILTQTDARRNPQILHILELAEEICPDRERKEGLAKIREDYQLDAILEDERLSITWKRGYEAFFYGDYDYRSLRFARLDVQLCMVKEREEILSQMDIVRKEYAPYYDKLKDFLEKLQDGKGIAFLKESLTKEYERLRGSFNGGYYYELYPEEKNAPSQKVIVDGSKETPYVRSGKKIGRNDPCPCGSGKKYKQCCMNKA